MTSYPKSFVKTSSAPNGARLIGWIMLTYQVRNEEGLLQFECLSDIAVSIFSLPALDTSKTS